MTYVRRKLLELGMNMQWEKKVLQNPSQSKIRKPNKKGKKVYPQEESTFD